MCNSPSKHLVHSFTKREETPLFTKRLLLENNFILKQLTMWHHLLKSSRETHTQVTYTQQDRTKTYFGAWRSFLSWRAYAGGRCWAYITGTIHALPRVKTAISTYAKGSQQTYWNTLWGWHSLGCLSLRSWHSLPCSAGTSAYLNIALQLLFMYEIILSKIKIKNVSTNIGLIPVTLFFHKYFIVW